jgi:hypothetical protein
MDEKQVLIKYLFMKFSTLQISEAAHSIPCSIKPQAREAVKAFYLLFYFVHLESSANFTFIIE